MPRRARPNATQRGYGPKWKAAREEFLRVNRFCVFCEQRGVRTPATTVDHKVPHRGDWKLFWDRKNWQSLCKPCHDGPKQSQERTGRVRGCDANGFPLDTGHHWRRA